MTHRQHDQHGDRCSCRLLAEAVGCDPKAVRFSYCQKVLMKRWVIECNHGCCHAAPASGSSDRWHEVGPMDPIKALLIKNG